MKTDDPRHGTWAGYQAHRHDGESPCDRCREASRARSASARSKLKADAAQSRERMIEVTTAQLQERVTYEAHPCPECGQAMVGARVFDPVAQEAFVGCVCVSCDGAYRIVWSAA